MPIQNHHGHPYMHHHGYRHEKHILICYKNFSKDCNVSHIGLGVTAAYTAKTLIDAGYFAQALPIFDASDLMKFIAAKEYTKHPVTHVLISAQFLPSVELQKMVRQYPEIKFAMNCHSNIGFLQAEPRAISLVREAIDLEVGVSNFHMSVNNRRTQSALQGMYGRPITYLPNLYNLHGAEPVNRPLWNGGTLRIGAYGSLRVYKNFSVAIAASVELAHKLKCQAEIWINHGRSDGAGNIVYQAASAWTKGLPNVTLKEFQWASWPEFKRQIGSMNILMQPSYTETFNNVTADGIAEGVPSVVGESIEWAPESWKTDPDNATQASGIARRLLFDPHAAQEGYDALKEYVHRGLQSWESYLDRK